MADLPDSSTIVVKGVSKRFGSTVALNDVSIDLRAGQVIALAGGNGSGKSTLLRIIAGGLPQDYGTVSVGECALSGGVQQARRAGIEIVLQSEALCPDASVLENMFLGAELIDRLGFLHTHTMRARAAHVITEFELPVPDLAATTRVLSGGQQKSVAIARALLSDPRFLLLDEPTTALGVKQQGMIMDVIRMLQRKGVGIILCTHSVDEIMTVASRVLVLRNGEIVKNCDISTLSRETLAILMSA